ncbi:MAG: DUF501 domain-containing protein [Actinomycetota bacterium]|nr:DUF501 domain-containing protein [Actinomycetota bacterium]
MDDRSVVQAQIGRPPRSTIDVTARCHLGLPIVITVPPLLDDDTPFPTLYWLTCPLAAKRIGRVEAGGGVRQAELMIADDPALVDRHSAAAERYRTSREAMIPDGYVGYQPTGGVGGTGAGVKCLHAHYADTAAGNDNPVGEWTAAQIEPLDCGVACVADAGDGTAIRNPGWIEPR